MTTLVDIRCRRCGRLLMRVDAKDARIETVCPNRDCRVWQSVKLPRTG